MHYNHQYSILFVVPIYNSNLKCSTDNELHRPNFFSTYFHNHIFDTYAFHIVILPYWKLTLASIQEYALYIIRGKKILKFSLVLRTSTPKYLLVLLQNRASHSRKNNLTLYLFYLPFGHWMKIFACPD